MGRHVRRRRNRGLRLLLAALLAIAVTSATGSAVLLVAAYRHPLPVVDGHLTPTAGHVGPAIGVHYRPARRAT